MAVAPIFAGNVALASILQAISPVLAWAAIVTFAFSMHAWAGRLTGRIAGARAGLPLERLRGRITRWRGHHPRRHPIGDVEPPAWVAVAAAGHEPRTVLEHRLCTARHRVDGGPVTLAFSDGTAQAWHPGTRVAAGPYPGGAPTGGRRAAAAALGPLVRDIARNGCTPLESVVDNHSEEHPEPAVRHAVQAAVLWGLIATADRRDTQRLYALLGEPDPAEAAGIGLTVTSAGRVWLGCDPRRSAGPGRRTRPGPARTEGDVLAALAELLRIPEVWERPGLRPARDTLTGAVSGGRPDTPAVRSAIDQVLTLAGGLVLGVAGTGAYHVLRGFAG
jgi:hypothetical protein